MKTAAIRLFSRQFSMPAHGWHQQRKDENGNHRRFSG